MNSETHESPQNHSSGKPNAAPPSILREPRAVSAPLLREARGASRVECGFLRLATTVRDCPCPVAGRSLRASSPPLTRMLPSLRHPGFARQHTPAHETRSAPHLSGNPTPAPPSLLRKRRAAAAPPPGSPRRKPSGMRPTSRCRCRIPLSLRFGLPNNSHASSIAPAPSSGSDEPQPPVLRGARGASRVECVRDHTLLKPS